MKKPINIYRRYKRPIRYRSVFVPLAAITDAMGAASISFISSQPFHPHEEIPIDDRKKQKSIQVFETILNTTFGVFKAQQHDRLSRFKAIGRYGSGKFNFNKIKLAHDKALEELRLCK